MRENLGQEMCALYRQVGIFAAEKPVLQALDRIERLSPLWIHPIGGGLPHDTAAGYVRALRTQPFAYEGKLLGRLLPT